MFLPLMSSGGLFTPLLSVHIRRSPGGAPDSCTTSMTSLPLGCSSMVWLYQAPAKSTWPEIIASSAPTPPFCSVESSTFTPNFL